MEERVGGGGGVEWGTSFQFVEQNTMLNTPGRKAERSRPWWSVPELVPELVPEGQDYVSLIIRAEQSLQ